MKPMTNEDLEARKDKWFAKFPRWNLKKCKLREVRSEDAAHYYKYIMHKEVAAFVPVDCWPDSLEWAEDHLRFWRSQFINRSGFCWSIADKKTDKMIGSITMTRLRPLQRKAVFSYDLDRDYWGQGIMSEAMEAVIDFADNKLDLGRLYACASPENVRSIKLLERLGFVSEGLMKNYEVLEWEVVDFEAFSRTRKCREP